jgi:hypothetical protein
VNAESDLVVVNWRGAFVSKVDADGTVSDFSRSDLFACPSSPLRLLNSTDGCSALSFPPRL